MSTTGSAKKPHSARLDDARPDDIEALARLDALCFATAWSAEHYRGEIGCADRILRVVREVACEHPVALLNARAVVDEIHLFRLATAPAATRRGYARLLMGDLIATAPRRGFRCVLLEVGAGNVAALAIYRSLGFVTTTRRVGYYGDGDDALLMTLEL